MGCSDVPTGPLTRSGLMPALFPGLALLQEAVHALVMGRFAFSERSALADYHYAGVCVCVVCVRVCV